MRFAFLRAGPPNGLTISRNRRRVKTSRSPKTLCAGWRLHRRDTD